MTRRSRLAEVVQLTRIRGTIEVASGSFMDAVDAYPADLNIFGMQRDVDFEVCRQLMRVGRASAVFVKGSGAENAFA